MSRAPEPRRPAFRLASLPARLLASLPARLLASLPARLLASLPARLLASLPARLLASLRARLLAVAAALLVVLPLALGGGIQYLCLGMGRIMDECCCPSQRSVHAQSVVKRGSEVKPRDCCERFERGLGEAFLAYRQDASFGAGALALLDGSLSAGGASGPEGRDVRVEPLAARRFPPRGPPLFIAHCALLI